MISKAVACGPPFRTCIASIRIGRAAYYWLLAEAAQVVYDVLLHLCPDSRLLDAHDKVPATCETQQSRIRNLRVGKDRVLI